MTGEGRMHGSAGTEETPSLMLRIDGPCVRFEERCKAGERPSIETFLDEAAAGDREALLAELLLLEWTYRRQRGESVSLDECTERFSAWREAVERAWQSWAGAETRTGEAEAFDTTPPAAAPPIADGAAAPAGYQDVVAVGRGGMGVVYRAFDPRLERTVALKCVLPERVTPEGLRRFRQEAKAVARLRHPHVVQVHGWEETPQGPTLVMEYVPGGSLESWLRGRTLAPAEAARLVAILARAVQAAHDAGVVHRDLKPENVLLAPGVPGNSGTVGDVFPKLTDFGLSMLAGDERQTRPGMVFGTPQYMPPEQASGDVEALGPKADVWALGVILYRCLSGRAPFKGGNVLETLELIRTRPAPPLGLPGESAALERLCLRCLEKEPERRPTAGELADELDRLASVTVSVAVTTAARCHRAWVVVACLVAALVLAGGLGWRLWSARGGRGDEAAKDGREQAPGAAKAEALAVRSLRVVRYPHLEKDQDDPKEQGEIGKDTFTTRYDDVVRAEAELSEPGHAFLITFTPDGKHTLLWPCDEKGKPDARRPPPLAKAARYHATDEGRGFRLEENPEGGTQAFVLVASREPLPPFAEWSKGWTDRPWRVLAARPMVWVSDGDWIETKAAGARPKRSLDAPLPNEPLLKPLCRGLKEAGADVVEGIAFGVRAKEGER
jgi:hypothetical protein